MATHTAVRPSKHATLVAKTVDTVPFSSKPKTIEVRNLDSTAVIFFASTPPDCQRRRHGPPRSRREHASGRRRCRSATGPRVPVSRHQDLEGRCGTHSPPSTSLSGLITW